jgi:hypothetical protein
MWSQRHLGTSRKMVVPLRFVTPGGTAAFDTLDKPAAPKAQWETKEAARNSLESSNQRHFSFRDNQVSFHGVLGPPEDSCKLCGIWQSLGVTDVALSDYGESVRLACYRRNTQTGALPNR